ncbi:hypothetical protein A0H81_02372 [Grifola frondosa]|uniref:LYC1 C-terminal domain-containing protein n=1 Tax=Grifola frondosa TaxID=5627 RepID=A0A1C7MM25_GRIFR|nr:hypothetical protein A0H81_02372 [Grifola frondosa]
MDTHEHAADGKLVTWVLAPRSDPATLDFMCACETFRRHAIVAETGIGKKPELREVTGYGIASVFTLPSNRGKGYARHMMCLLHWVLAPRSVLPFEFPATWGAPPDREIAARRGMGVAQFSVLYSDVGPDFYRACGPERDSRTGGRTSFTFLPDKGVGAFVVQRTMSFTPNLEPVLPSNTWGVLLLPAGASDLGAALAETSLHGLPSFVAWTLDLRTSPRTLVVTRLRANTSTLPRLLNLMKDAARKADVEKIEIWYLPDKLQAVANEQGWKTAERLEHLSAVKWYGRKSEADIDWVFNEKFCWC